MSIVTSASDRSSAVGPWAAAAIRASTTRARSMRSAVAQRARERSRARAGRVGCAETADRRNRRQEQGLDRDAGVANARSSPVVASTWSVPRTIAARSRIAASQTSGPIEDGGHPDDGRGAISRSRRAGAHGPPSQRRAVEPARSPSRLGAGRTGRDGERRSAGWYARRRHRAAMRTRSVSRRARLGFAPTQARRSARDRVLRTSAAVDPAATRLGDAPPHVVELARVVGVRIDRQDAAGRDRPTGALGGQVEPMRRAVDLERRARPRPPPRRPPPSRDRGRRGSGSSGPAGWAMMSTCGLRIALSVRRVSSARGWRRGDVDGRDDDVEPREQVVVVVEHAVGPDLELAAMEEPEALRRRLRRRRAGAPPPPRTGH